MMSHSWGSKGQLFHQKVIPLPLLVLFIKLITGFTITEKHCFSTFGSVCLYVSSNLARVGLSKKDVKGYYNTDCLFSFCLSPAP